ncbi:hypothetical protein [Neptuniibacter sp.]|uniref:hypothetical protein n=1 Tax=Neptuniibacter sp. TaxID=1962643 RepID=UPI003B5A9D0A
MSGFRDRLEEEVNRIGVTAISNNLGVARNTIYNWLAKGNVPLNYLMAFDGLGMDARYIIYGERSLSAISEDEKELLDLFRVAPIQVKAAVLGALTAGNSPEQKHQDLEINKSSVVVTGDSNRIAGNNYKEK